MREKINIQLILKGCQQGNRNSQRKLYEHFYGYAMSVCLRFSRNKEEAAEVLNDAFVKVFNHLDRYDTAFPFQGWLRRILVNAAIDYHRKHHKQPGFLELSAAHERADDEIPMPQISPEEDLLPILQKLPPAYRMVFNLFVLEDFKHHEIAEMLGISVSTSRSNFVRAKEKLREIILERNNRTIAKTTASWKTL